MLTLDDNRLARVHEKATSERLDSKARVPAIRWVVGTLLSPTSIDSLIVLRIFGGAFFAWWAWDYLETGRVTDLYVTPKFHFTYAYLDWIRPWPGEGMYLHFASIIVFAIGVACGVYYRITAPLLAASFTYVFLLDRTNYQNHYYLMLLIAWLFTLVPLNRMVSVDAHYGFSKPESTIPTWMLWLVRFHIALPYFFGGVAKINSDWLCGHPMQEMLAARSNLPVLGPLLAQTWMVPLSAWGSMLFDLSVVPLLWWQKTRFVAYFACVGFHVANSVLFNIHVFPWLMILATTVFFEPSWPRQLLGGQPDAAVPTRPATTPRFQLALFLGLTIASAYIGFHSLWPLRHRLYPGNASWTEQGHHFAWRMMLRGKISGARYYVTDKRTGQTYIPSMKSILAQEQFQRFSHDPEMILHLAHFLARRHKDRFGDVPVVKVLALASLNGRQPQLLIDPNINLVDWDRNEISRPWVVPLREPLPEVSWNVPIAEWERQLKIKPPCQVTLADPFANGGT